MESWPKQEEKLLVFHHVPGSEVEGYLNFSRTLGWIDASENNKAYIAFGGFAEVEGIHGDKSSADAEGFQFGYLIWLIEAELASTAMLVTI